MPQLRCELTDTAAEHERQQNEDGGDEQHELSPCPPLLAKQLLQHPGSAATMREDQSDQVS